MVNRRQALKQLEEALRYWYYWSDQEFPTIGVVIIGLSVDGVDMQYMGNDPATKIDWPVFFKQVVEALDAGAYTVQDDKELKFPSQR